VTLAVSVLRGVLELEGGEQETASGARGAGERAGGRDSDADAEPRGGWWLTDEARPVFAIGAADGPGAGGSPRETGERLLRDLEARIEDRALRRVLTRLADALDDPRRLRAEATRWEGELLDIAAPRPLRMVAEGDADPDDESPGRETMRTVPRRGDRPPRRRDLRTAGRADGHRAAAAGERRRTDPTPRSGSPRERRKRREPRSGRGPAGMPRVRGALRRAQERLERLMPFGGRPDEHARVPAPRPERATGRRRWKGPALVAVSAAAVIAVAGALWPSGTGSADAAGRTAETTPVPSASGEQSSPAPSATASGIGGAAPDASGRTRTPGASAQSDPLAAGEELIAAARSCQGEPQPECTRLWDGGAAASGPVRDADGPPALIEDYGDIAAIRNGAGDGAQMVVVIRRDAEWRIRDVYDIADPPSEGTGAP